jgi:nucleoside-diphosphate-sugar epimerase
MQTNQSNKLPILIIGASGKLGSLVTNECLNYENLLVNIFIRNRDKCKDLCCQIEKRGGKCIVGDITKEETIKDCTKGIHTIISCVVGSDDIVIDGQKRILEDAIKHQVKRFVPSDYSMDVSQIQEGQHELTDQRKKFRKEIEKYSSKIKSLHINQGLFMETLMSFVNVSGGRPFYWGDNIDQKIDLTSYADLARFIACAVSNPDRCGDMLIRGDELNTKKICDVYFKVTGEKVEPVRLGSIDDLKNRIKEGKKKLQEARSRGEIHQLSHISDFTSKDYLMDAMILPYQLFLFEGKGKLEKIKNDEFPKIKPEDFEQFLRNHPEMRFKKKEEVH